MSKLNSVFYDIYKSYDDNYKTGPVTLEKFKKVSRLNSKKYSFLGFPVNLPFGIPSGPLLNNKYMKAAFDFGFDVSTYKTVRTDFFPSHPYPNVVYVKAPKDLHPDKTKRLKVDENKNKLGASFTITNSFGVPSKKPKTWQNDVRKSLKHEKEGQLLILSFMGTVKPNQTQDEFIDDYVLGAKLANETGAKVLEMNLSCPNIGNEGLVCYNLDVTEKICKKVKKQIGKTPLIIKVGYFPNKKDLKRLAEIAHKYVDAVAVINTLQTEVVKKNGEQALPGKMRLRSGVCGSAIRWAGLEMVDQLNKLRKRNKYKYEIIGIGGVIKPKDFFEYRKAGADLVQSATGAMWNPYLAHEIEKRIK